MNAAVESRNDVDTVVLSAAHPVSNPKDGGPIIVKSIIPTPASFIQSVLCIISYLPLGLDPCDEPPKLTKEPAQDHVEDSH